MRPARSIAVLKTAGFCGAGTFAWPRPHFPETLREPRCIANPSGIFALPRNTRPCSGKIARFLPPETLPSGTAHRSWGRLVTSPVSAAREVPAKDCPPLVPTCVLTAGTMRRDESRHGRQECPRHKDRKQDISLKSAPAPPCARQFHFPPDSE